MGFFKNVEILTDDKGVKFTGVQFADFDLKNLQSDTDYIRANEIYRPDKVANRLYKRVDWAFIIEDVNDWYDGFADYTVDRPFTYPLLSELNNIGA